MRLRRALLLAAIAGGTVSTAAGQTIGEPSGLILPVGAGVRVQTTAAPGHWVKGVLASADSAGIALIPQDAAPLGANALRLPGASVGRFELRTGSKRRWLPGLIAGVALGVAAGFVVDVDPVACKYDPSYLCNRGQAVGYGSLGGGGLGAGIGALIKTDQWTPIALDSLPPPAPRISGTVPHLRSRPGGGMELGVTISF